MNFELSSSTTSGRSRSRASRSGSIYALIALGYTLVYGVLRLINFAHSEVFMIGTFAVVWAVGWLGIDHVAAAAWRWCSSRAASWPASSPWRSRAASAVLLERIAYRPLRTREARHGWRP